MRHAASPMVIVAMSLGGAAWSWQRLVQTFGVGGAVRRLSALVGWKCLSVPTLVADD